MKNLKVILAIAAFVGIGFLAGFYTHRYLSQQKIEKVARMRSPEGFREAFFQLVDAGPEQREQLAPIIDRYSQAMERSHRSWRRSRHALIDSMHREVMPYLDEPQSEKLRKFNRRFRGDHKDKESSRK